VPEKKYDSAAKRHRQSEKHRMRNRIVRSTVRTSVKKFLSAVESKDKAKAETAYKAMEKLIDSAAGKKVYHRNTTARKKSRMHKLLNTMGV